MAPLPVILAAIGSAASAAAPIVAAGSAIYGVVSAKQQADAAKKNIASPVGAMEHIESTMDSEARKEQQRRMKQASAIMMKDWESPVLGVPGMLGVSE